MAVGKAVSAWAARLLGDNLNDIVAALDNPPELTGEAVAAVHQFLYSGKPTKERFGKDKDGRWRTAARAWSAAPVGEVSPGEYWREKARRPSDSMRR